MFRYHLAHGKNSIFLFESQFRFLTEDQCLRHYEKGIARGLFHFDRARINRVWAELLLWGLIGHVRPVELVRILCAFGCEIRLIEGGEPQSLLKSFRPVTYFIPVASDQRPTIRHIYHRPLELGSTEQIPLLFEIDDRLVLGAYYTTDESDPDFQFPKFCEELELDLCLPSRTIWQSLSSLFWRGYRINAECRNQSMVLASHDKFRETIRGFGGEQSLFYLASGHGTKSR